MPLPNGCYLLSLLPANPLDEPRNGTLRVEQSAAGLTITGDLYALPVASLSPLPQTPPAFPRNAYRSYLHTVTITAPPSTLKLACDNYLPQPNGSWTAALPLTLSLLPNPAFPGTHFTGTWQSLPGSPQGQLTLIRIGPFLRHIHLLFESESTAHLPLNNGAGLDFPTLFSQISLLCTTDVHRTTLTPPFPNAPWLNDELHNTKASAAIPPTDALWAIHILSVNNLHADPRGVMYDADETDVDASPRQGLAVGMNFPIPNDPRWGLNPGTPFGTHPAALFRTTAHELGHALGLFHNTSTPGFMMTTEQIIARSSLAKPFLSTLDWSYAPFDTHFLKHTPDPYIRPGHFPPRAPGVILPPSSPALLF